MLGIISFITHLKPPIGRKKCTLSSEGICRSLVLLAKIATLCSTVGSFFLMGGFSRPTHTTMHAGFLGDGHRDG